MPRSHIMTGSALYGVLSLLFLALLCPPVFAEVPAHLSQDPQVNRARGLIDRGHHRAALKILRPLADSARADSTDIRFLIGLAASASATQSNDPEEKIARLDEAIAALHAILINRPQLTRVRLELARAFFLKGDDDLSKTHFDRVIASNPPAATVANIRRFLHVIRARRRWNGYFSIDIEQNDNLNSGTETETVYLFGLPFALNEDSRPRSGVGVSFAGGGDYQYPLNAHWRWRFGADAARSEYRGHDFDQTYLSFRSGPRWLLSRRSDASLQAFVSQRWYAHHPYNTEFGVRSNVRHQLTPRIGINGYVSWRKTAYQQSSIEQAPDDSNVAYSLGGTYLFSPLLQGSAGIEFSHRHPNQERPNRRGFNVGLSKIFPRGWTLGTHLEWSRQGYGYDVPCALQDADQAMLCAPQRQANRRFTARLFLLNRGLTLFGFSPQVIVTRERQASNSVLRSYHRTRVDLRFVQQF